MTPDDIEHIVRRTLAQDQSCAAERVAATVKAVFNILGVNVEDEVEVRELKSGVQRMVRWDKSVGQIEKAGLKTAAAILITGTLGALWLGFLDVLMTPIRKMFGH